MEDVKRSVVGSEDIWICVDGWIEIIERRRPGKFSGCCMVALPSRLFAEPSFTRLSYSTGM